MTAIPIPLRGRWVWDVRGEGRAVRVSTHGHAGVLNLSLWRGNACVGTARLLPEDVAALVTALSDGLAELASADPGTSVSSRRMHELELRLTRLEREISAPAWRRVVPTMTSWARRGVGLLPKR